MDSQVFLTVWMLTAVGTCLCQNDQIQPLNGAVGGIVEIPLNPPSVTPQTFSWSFGSVTICNAIGDVMAVSPSYEHRASVDGTTAALVLRDLTLSDSGEYTLTLRVNGVESSPATTLTVFENVSDPAITISGSPDLDPLVAGKSSVSLTCEAKGSITTRKWMKNGGTLSAEPDRVIISEDNRTVSICPVQKEDIGEYKCQVSNPVSNVEASRILKVNYGPGAVFIKGEGHEGVVEFGHQIHLSCSAESVPDCTYTWTLNGTHEIVTGPSYIKENSTYEDSGIYTCTASNSITAGTKKGDFGLSVKGLSLKWRRQIQLQVTSS
ncbi:carcinoembryonic antigen-related cell adhesion molecule 8-like [Engraulis encrasicolus]|uniref:carcinoembryonic antigen-related cell adhesion molecule 8-like n=1 Tax=Engraulis encrasicolus TaxID=184585 RepID=UPI002FD050BA